MTLVALASCQSRANSQITCASKDSRSWWLQGLRLQVICLAS